MSFKKNLFSLIICLALSIWFLSFSIFAEETPVTKNDITTASTQSSTTIGNSEGTSYESSTQSNGMSIGTGLKTIGITLVIFCSITLMKRKKYK